jgi:predicted nucleic acid-binding protein
VPLTRRALGRLRLLGVDEVPIHELLSRVELRTAVSAYDALLLAESRELALVTSDSRLARTATDTAAWARLSGPAGVGY